MSKNSLKLAVVINGLKETPFVSDAYRRLVPDLKIVGDDEKGSVANFSDFSNMMLNDGYEIFQNEFIGAVVNKIALTSIVKKSFNNPLALFKKGTLNKGVDVELIFNNPAVAEEIGELTDANMQKTFKVYKADTKAFYLRTNRNELYPISIPESTISRAFQSLDSMEKFIVDLVETLSKGDQIDEFKYFKKLIDNAVSKNYVRQVVIDSDIETEDTLKKFAAKLKRYAIDFTLPSSLNNAYSNFPDSMGNPAIITSEPDEICLIIRSDMFANMDVAVLASAFNLDKTTFKGRVLVVDKFDNPYIVAAICEEAFLQNYDAEKRMTQQWNARMATNNWFLRCRGTFAISPFANAIVFLNNASGKPSITGTDIEVDATTVAVDEVHNFRFTPTNATETVSLKNTSTATVVIDNDNKTFKATSAGTVILQLVSNGAVVSDTVTAS